MKFYVYKQFFVDLNRTDDEIFNETESRNNKKLLKKFQIKTLNRKHRYICKMSSISYVNQNDSTKKYSRVCVVVEINKDFE